MVRCATESSKINKAVLFALLSVRGGRALTCCSGRNELEPNALRVLNRSPASVRRVIPTSTSILRSDRRIRGISPRSRNRLPSLQCLVSKGIPVVMSEASSSAAATNLHRTKRHRNAFLSRNDDRNRDNGDPLALVILNTREDTESKELLRHIWRRSDFRVCADGGANRLYDSFKSDVSEERAQYVPDLIVGDLDSLRPEVAAYYQVLGAEVKHEPDQDHNDFEKCLVEVEHWLRSSNDVSQTTRQYGKSGAELPTNEDQRFSERCRSPSTGDNSATVVGLGAFGGRFDHEMAALSLLHAYNSRFCRLVLMGAGNVAFLLAPGFDHIIEPDERFEGPTVGLLPVGGACRSVTTEGLKWNIEEGSLEFGFLVSSSNSLMGKEVRVVTDAPLVWTAEFKASQWASYISEHSGL